MAPQLSWSFDGNQLIAFLTKTNKHIKHNHTHAHTHETVVHDGKLENRFPYSLAILSWNLPQTLQMVDARQSGCLAGNLF